MEAGRVNSEGDATEGVELHVTNSTMLSTEPVMKMRERLQALKGLQLKTSGLESKFFSELHALEKKYSSDFNKLFVERNQIIKGEKNPAETELVPEDESLKNVALQFSGIGSDVMGVPDFWLTVFRNSSTLSDVVRPYDEPILSSLEHIEIEYIDNPMGFSLVFHFAPNDYFTNKTLVKSYHLNTASSPFKHDAEIYKSVGTKIDWCPDKDVTTKLGKKRQRHRTTGNMRVVDRVMKTESFFNFFDPPIVPEDPKVEVKDEIHMRLAADYEIGQYFRTRIIPHAFLYYIGQVPEQDDNYQDLDTETSEQSASETEED